MLESLGMGCVVITKMFFSDGVITKSRIKQADLYARQQIAPVRYSFRKMGWEQCVGTSGSIRSISKVLLANDFTDGTITDKSLKQLLDKLIEFELINKIKLEGLSSERQQVFIGGLIVLNAVLNLSGSATVGAVFPSLLID